MRKLYCLVSAAVIALGLASCSKEPVKTADRQITIVANTESGVDTKTSLSGNDQTGYQVLWNEGDEIRILAPGKVLRYSLTNGAGTTRGTFTGQSPVGNLPINKCWAYYATDGSTLPDITYYKAANSISSAPMYAQITIENGVASDTHFKNLCGLLRLTLKGSSIIKRIKIIDDAPLYGEIDRIASDGSVVLKSANQSEYTLIHDCGAGVELSADGTDFYIPMPPGDYEGITIEVINDFGETSTRTMKTGKILNITRSKVTPVSLDVTDLDSDIPGALAGVFTVNEAGKKVRFSRGNMYWNGDSFKFEILQSNRQTGWDPNHVNHFYWSWYADEASARDYDVTWPVGIFPNEEYDRNIAGHSFTVNGVTGKYRVLSIFEWEHLFEKHSHKWVTVNDVPGYVIAPDGVELGNKLSYTNEELSAGNLVFLPVTGIRNGQTIWDISTIGYYWTSSINQDNYGGYMYLSRDGVDRGAVLYDGCCIRLVVDID